MTKLEQITLNFSELKPIDWAWYGEGLRGGAFGIRVFYRISGEPGHWTLETPNADRYKRSQHPSQAAAKATANEDYKNRVASLFTCTSPDESLSTSRQP